MATTPPTGGTPNNNANIAGLSKAEQILKQRWIATNKILASISDKEFRDMISSAAEYQAELNDIDEGLQDIADLFLLQKGNMAEVVATAKTQLTLQKQSIAADVLAAKQRRDATTAGSIARAQADAEYKAQIQRQSELIAGASQFNSLLTRINRSLRTSTELAEDYNDDLLETKKVTAEIKEVQGQLVELEHAKKSGSLEALGIKDEEYEKMKQILEKQKESLKVLEEENVRIDKKIALFRLLPGIISKIPGLDSVINLEDFDKKTRQAAQRGEGVFKAAAKSIGNSFMDMMKDPMAMFSSSIVLLKSLYKLGNEVNERVAKLGNDMGISMEKAAGVYKYYERSATGFLSTYREVAELASTMNEKLGTASVFSGKQLNNTVELKNTLGLTNDEAATLYQTGTKTVDVVYNQVNALQDQKGLRIDAKKLSKDVLGQEGLLRAQLAKNSTEFVKQAASAAKVGSNIKEARDISRSFLDFESSIQAQMEAEVMTGKTINLDKARLLALQGKSGEALEEALGKNATLESFNNMNVLQQESYAKALGMSVDQMGDILYKKKQMGKEGMAEVEMLRREHRDTEASALEQQLMKHQSLKDAKEAAEQQKVGERATEQMHELLLNIAEGVRPAVQFVNTAIGGFFKLVKDNAWIKGALKGLGAIAGIAGTVTALVSAGRLLANLFKVGKKKPTGTDDDPVHVATSVGPQAPKGVVQKLSSKFQSSKLGKSLVGRAITGYLGLKKYATPATPLTKAQQIKAAKNANPNLTSAQILSNIRSGVGTGTAAGTGASIATPAGGGQVSNTSTGQGTANAQVQATAPAPANEVTLAGGLFSSSNPGYVQIIGGKTSAVQTGPVKGGAPFKGGYQPGMTLAKLTTTPTGMGPKAVATPAGKSGSTYTVSGGNFNTSNQGGTSNVSYGNTQENTTATSGTSYTTLPGTESKSVVTSQTNELTEKELTKSTKDGTASALKKFERSPSLGITLDKDKSGKLQQLIDVVKKKESKKNVTTTEDTTKNKSNIFSRTAKTVSTSVSEKYKKLSDTVKAKATSVFGKSEENKVNTKTTETGLKTVTTPTPAQAAAVTNPQPAIPTPTAPTKQPIAGGKFFINKEAQGTAPSATGGKTAEFDTTRITDVTKNVDKSIQQLKTSSADVSKESTREVSKSTDTTVKNATKETSNVFSRGFKSLATTINETTKKVVDSVKSKFKKESVEEKKVTATSTVAESKTVPRRGRPPIFRPEPLPKLPAVPKTKEQKVSLAKQVTAAKAATPGMTAVEALAQVRAKESRVERATTLISPAPSTATRAPRVSRPPMPVMPTPTTPATAAKGGSKFSISEESKTASITATTTKGNETSTTRITEVTKNVDKSIQQLKTSSANVAKESTREASKTTDTAVKNATKETSNVFSSGVKSLTSTISETSKKIADNVKSRFKKESVENKKVTALNTATESKISTTATTGSKVKENSKFSINKEDITAKTSTKGAEVNTTRITEVTKNVDKSIQQLKTSNKDISKESTRDISKSIDSTAKSTTKETTNAFSRGFKNFVSSIKDTTKRVVEDVKSKFKKEDVESKKTKATANTVAESKITSTVNKANRTSVTEQTLASKTASEFKAVPRAARPPIFTPTPVRTPPASLPRTKEEKTSLAKQIAAAKTATPGTTTTEALAQVRAKESKVEKTIPPAPPRPASVSRTIPAAPPRPTAKLAAESSYKYYIGTDGKPPRLPIPTAPTGVRGAKPPMPAMPTMAVPRISRPPMPMVPGKVKSVEELAKEPSTWEKYYKTERKIPVAPPAPPRPAAAGGGSKFSISEESKTANITTTATKGAEFDTTSITEVTKNVDKSIQQLKTSSKDVATESTKDVSNSVDTSSKTATKETSNVFSRGFKQISTAINETTKKVVDGVRSKFKKETTEDKKTKTTSNTVAESKTVTSENKESKTSLAKQVTAAKAATPGMTTPEALAQIKSTGGSVVSESTKNLTSVEQTAIDKVKEASSTSIDNIKTSNKTATDSAIEAVKNSSKTLTTEATEGIQDTTKTANSTIQQTSNESLDKFKQVSSTSIDTIKTSSTTEVTTAANAIKEIGTSATAEAVKDIKAAAGTGGGAGAATAGGPATVASTLTQVAAEAETEAGAAGEEATPKKKGSKIGNFLKGKFGKSKLGKKFGKLSGKLGKLGGKYGGLLSAGMSMFGGGEEGGGGAGGMLSTIGGMVGGKAGGLMSMAGGLMGGGEEEGGEEGAPSPSTGGGGGGMTTSTPSKAPTPKTSAPKAGGGGGFFSKLMGKGEKAAGKAGGGLFGKVGGFLGRAWKGVKGVAGKLNPGKYIGKLFQGEGLKKILGKLPKIGSLISLATTAYGLYQQGKGAAEAAKQGASYQDIGKQVVHSVADLGGSLIGGILGSVVPGAGTIVGSMIGGFGAGALADLIVNNVDVSGLGKSVVGLFGGKGGGKDEKGKTASVDGVTPMAVDPVTHNYSTPVGPSANVTKLAEGGLVTSTGMAKVDKGEVYLGANSITVLNDMLTSLKEQNKLLLQLVAKDTTIHMDGQKVGNIVARNVATTAGNLLNPASRTYK